VSRLPTSAPETAADVRGRALAAGAQRRWSLARKLALQCALLPALFLALELGYRGWQRFEGHPYRGSEALAEIRRVAGALSDHLAGAGAEHPRPEREEPDARTFLHPFLGFAVEYFQDSFAKDVAYFESDAAKANFDVLIVGGSVAGGLCENAGMALVEGLRADPRLRERMVRLHMYATGGFKQPQQLNLVSYVLALGMKPDAVVEVDGFNELALSNYNALHGSHPLHPSLSHWLHLVGNGQFDREGLDRLIAMRRAQRDAAALAERTERLGLHASAILGRWSLSRLHRVRRDYTGAYQAYVEHMASSENATLRGPSYEPSLENVLELAVRNWSESSRSLAAICEARGIHYLHVLQPTLHDAGSKPLSEAELETSAAQDGWIEAVRDGYPRLREAGEELHRQGVHFVDASRIFAGVREDLYFDACHFNAAGHALFAREICGAFLASLP